MCSITIFWVNSSSNTAFKPSFGGICQAKFSNPFKSWLTLLIADTNFKYWSIFTIWHQRTRLLNYPFFLTLNSWKLIHSLTLTVNFLQVTSEKLRSISGSTFWNHSYEGNFAVALTVGDLALLKLEQPNGRWERGAIGGARIRRADAFSRSIFHIRWALNLTSSTNRCVSFRTELIALRVDHPSMWAISHFTLSNIAIFPTVGRDSTTTMRNSDPERVSISC